MHMNKPSVQPNQCPLCEAEVKVDGTLLLGETSCPHCEKKLWFLAAPDEARFFDYENSGDLREKTSPFVAERLDVDRAQLIANPNMLNELEVDSLEALELLMDLEEELGLA